MIKKTRALVLHQVKYAESSLIVTLYTESSGRQSFIVNGIRSSGSKSKTGFFQPLFILEAEAYLHPGRSINRMKEYRILEVYQSIPYHVEKSAVAIFLAEILNKILKSEESDPALFDFIVDSLMYFDSTEAGFANFHLWFLLQLTAYLGFKPINNYSEALPWFHLKQGQYTAVKPSVPVTPNVIESKQLSELMNLDPAHLDQLRLNGASRSILLGHIVEYYAIHFEGIGKFNSLDVLSEVFA
jgi:DNA repair protein RecO (recombination protein O)